MNKPKEARRNEGSAWREVRTLCDGEVVTGIDQRVVEIGNLLIPVSGT